MLYQKFGRATFQRAYRKLGDREAAQDLTQEVFHSLLGVAERLEDSERTHRYLYRTTTNAIHRHLGQQRRLRTLHEAFAQELPAHPQSPDALSRRLAQLDLDALSAMLEQDEWEMLYYRYFEELPSGQIADIFEITDRGLRKRFARLQKKLDKLQRTLAP